MVMTHIQSFAVQNREHAGLLLAEKLRRFKDSQTIVIGVSHGGALIGYHLARALHLPFDVVPCKKINHPADPRKTIGSISMNEIVIHEDSRDIPRTYIHRQIVMNQNALKAQQAIYKSNHAEWSVKNKIVIIVGDVLNSVDAVLASLRSIKKRKPEEIIVAMHAATPEVVSRLLREADDVVVLTVENNVQTENFYEQYSLTSDEEVKELIIKAMKEFNQG
jgi:putative phosphoribosyl transferase